MKLPKFLTQFSASPVTSPFNSFLFGGDLRGGADDATATPVSEAAAMRVPAYAACIRILSDSISHMPLELKKKTDCGSEVVKDHPTLRALKDPDPKRPALTAQVLLKLIVQNIAVHGNAYLEQIRVKSGKVMSLRFIPPHRVEVCLNDKEELVYRITPPAPGGKIGKQYELSVPDILHFKGALLDADGYAGIGSLATCRDLLRASLEQLYHARASLIGGNVKGFLTFPDADITAEQVKEIRDTLNDPAVDNKWKAMPGNPSVVFPPGNNQMNQYVESRRASIAEYARVFGIPSFLLSDNTGISNYGSGLTEQAAGFVRYGLTPIAQSIEGVLDQCLLTDAERASGLHFAFDFKSFLRGTPSQRADYYMKGIASGWLSPAEARRMEGLVEKDGCDDLKPVTDVSMPNTAPPAGERKPNEPQTDPEE